MSSLPASRRPVRFPALLVRSLALAAVLLCATGEARAQRAGSADPRVGLEAGWLDAGTAIRNLELIATRPRPEGFFNPSDPGDFAFMNADMAFTGDTLFLGGFNGLQIWDISDPASPSLRSSYPCPGGQGDVSVYGDLLFMSVEEPRGRLDCGPQGVADSVSAERFRGVRIFDVSDLDAPEQLAAVQTCRGSHTHTLVTDPDDAANVYVYVSGTSLVRPGAELAGCSGLPPEEDPETALFRIEVIQVPLAAPQDARIVSMPRIFANTATGDIAGLWTGGRHGEGTQQTAVTDQCHDITVYPEVGLAAGACSGNGILLDIRDPANPARIDEVIDPNFAYWHSATFSNDAAKILFTDEWGGGLGPRCRASDLPEWGADAIFTRTGDSLRLAGYYKLPAPQTAQENCVAHNGTLIPVPGRDVMVQAWYQGGVSVFDFTDPDNPFEIAYFDRGPMDSTRLMMAGYWSTYWYNGHIYGSEIGRGLDVFRLAPSEHLTQNEINAANLVQVDYLNPQLQTRIDWPASFAVARAYLDQLVRADGISSDAAARLRAGLTEAEGLSAGPQRQAALSQLVETVRELQARTRMGAASLNRLQLLGSAIRELRGTR